jgi:hypothetical protein
MLPLTVLAQSDRQTPAERKKAFVSSCNEAGDEKLKDSKSRTIFHEYCECAGETLSNKFADADWDEVAQLSKDGKDSLSNAKMTPIIQPCLDELQRKLQAMK